MGACQKRRSIASQLDSGVRVSVETPLDLVGRAAKYHKPYVSTDFDALPAMLLSAI